MKVLYVLLLLSIAAIVVAVAAILWRLWWHLRRPGHASQRALQDIEPEQQPAEKV
jgi:hypothetical protein